MGGAWVTLDGASKREKPVHHKPLEGQRQPLGKSQAPLDANSA